MNAPRLILKREDWPNQDRAAWNALFVDGGIFDERGPCVDWSAGSRCKREQSYGHWLGFLTNAGLLDAACLPADRFTQDAVRAFVEATRARVSLITTSMQTTDLYVLATTLDPDRDWSWLKRIADRLGHQTGRWQLKPRPGVSVSTIFEWAISEIAEAEEMADDDLWRRPVRFRDGLMVGLLIARPVRVRAFMGIEVNKQLTALDDGFRLQFGAEDMKDRKARDFLLPGALVDPMRRYLAHYRPLLLRGNRTSKLWVSRRGGPLTTGSFTVHLAHITERAFGVTLRPHAFRHIAATSIAEEDPAHVNITASLLGHATLDMAEKHYNRASGARAAASYQDMVRGLRREARRKARARRNITPDGRSPGVAD